MDKMIRISIFTAALLAGGIYCEAVLGGPIDNANEFLDKAVEQAEERNYPPGGQADEQGLISISEDSPGTDKASGSDQAAAHEEDDDQNSRTYE